MEERSVGIYPEKQVLTPADKHQYVQLLKELEKEKKKIARCQQQGIRFKNKIPKLMKELEKFNETFDLSTVGDDPEYQDMVQGTLRQMGFNKASARGVQAQADLNLDRQIPAYARPVIG